MQAKQTAALPRLLAVLAVTALSGVVLSLLLSGLAHPATALSLHLAFAVGIMPLIFAAMTWFVPVLTRSGPAQPSALWPPLLALGSGLLLATGLHGRFILLPMAALLALIAALWISWWSWQRAAAALGGPHPGLLWYRLALGFLLLGLIAVLLGIAWPQYWPALRRFHMHANLLGFIGLTAVGTWRVLLPTAAGFADPDAAPWLRRQWRYLVPGTLLIATGAAWSPVLATAGLALWLLPLAGLVGNPLYRQRRLLCQLHGPAPTLAIAFIGLILLLLTGGLHASAPGLALPLNQAFILAFLLPLVTGAVNHLLPLWLLPRGSAAAQREIRDRLGRLGGARGLVFAAAGGLLLAGWEQAWLPALGALLHFLLAVLYSVYLLAKGDRPQN